MKLASNVQDLEYYDGPLSFIGVDEAGQKCVCWGLERNPEFWSYAVVYVATEALDAYQAQWLANSKAWESGEKEVDCPKLPSFRALLVGCEDAPWYMVKDGKPGNGGELVLQPTTLGESGMLSDMEWLEPMDTEVQNEQG